MKLPRVERRRPRHEKAINALVQEGEPNLFFDYQRDVPPVIQESIEEKFLSDENRNVGLDYLLPEVLGKPDLLKRIDLVGYAQVELTKCLNRKFLQQLEKSARDNFPQSLPSLIENFFDLLNLLGKESADFERLKQKLRISFSPENIKRIWTESIEQLNDPEVDDLNDQYFDDYQILRTLFVAFKLFPEYRAAYTALAEEHFEEYYRAISENCVYFYDIGGSARDLMQLWFLCPHRQHEILILAQKIKETCISELGGADLTDWKPSDLYWLETQVIFFLTTISKFDPEINLKGRIELTKKESQGKSTPLPERPQI